MKSPASIVVLDIETTGLDVAEGAIIELAAQRYEVRAGQLVEQAGQRIDTLVQPRVPIEPASQAIHGISELEARQRGREPAAAFAELAAFLGTDPLLAHNGIFFDYLYVPNECDRYGVELGENRLLDTLPLARRHLVSPGGYGMATLCAALGIVNERAHRALSDVQATADLFRHILRQEPDLERLWQQSYGYTLRTLREVPPGFELLELAMDQRRPLRIEYQSASKPRRERWIEPLRLDLTRAGKRSVRARCLESGTDKQFRLDRISKLIALG